MSQVVTEHYLIFVNAADDAAAFPASRLQSITCKTDSALLLKFSPGSLGEGQAASVDIVTLAITANTELAVMKKIFTSINNKGEGVNYTVVCDDVLQTRLTNITGCASITIDA